MRKFVPLLIVFSLILAACGTTQPTQAPANPTAVPATTEQPLPTAAEQAAPTTSALPDPTSTPEEAPQPENSSAASGPVTYTISALNSAVSYQVGEVFINDNNRFNTAVGVTKGISGNVQIDLSNPQNSTISPITIDISQFTSDSNRRDNAIRDRFLESSKYPNATFVPTKIEGLPESIQEGQNYPLKITGDLTVRDVTRPVTFDANVHLEKDRLAGQAATTLLMSDFGFGPISIAGILKTEDEVLLNLDFVAFPSFTE